MLEKEELRTIYSLAQTENKMRGHNLFLGQVTCSNFNKEIFSSKTSNNARFVNLTTYSMSTSLTQLVRASKLKWLGIWRGVQASVKVVYYIILKSY